MRAVCTLILLLQLLSSPARLHAQLASPVTPQQTATENPSSIPGITLLGTAGQRVVITASELQTMARTTLDLRNAHTGVVESYEGVLLPALLARVDAPLGPRLRGSALAVYLLAEGSDQYEALYSLSEVDPSFHPGTILVADRVDGQPLGPKDGPFKLVNNQDKRAARCVKNLVSLRLIPTR